MATGFEKLQSALDLSKFEDLFTSRKQLVLNKLGLTDKADIFDDATIFTAIVDLSSFIASINTAINTAIANANANVNAQQTIEQAIQKNVNDSLNLDNDNLFWRKFDTAELPLANLALNDGQPNLLKPVDIIPTLKKTAESFLDAIEEIALDDLHQKRETFAKEYELKFKEFNDLDRIALFNAVKIKDSKKVADFYESHDELKKQIAQLENMHGFIDAKLKNPKFKEQADKELKLIGFNIAECKRVEEKMKAMRDIMVNPNTKDKDYLALDNGVTYSVKTQEQYQDYISKTNGTKNTMASLGIPEERKIKYLEVEKRKDNQVGFFEKKYPGKEVSRYSLEGDASDPHWTSRDCPEDEKLLAEHTTRWAIDIIRQNGLPTKDRPLYIEEGSDKPQESKFLVIALMKVLKITSKDEANRLIKTDHTDWKPSDELSLIGGGFGRFSTYNSAFKDNKDVQKILANFENKNVVMMEIGKDFSYVERNEPQQPAVEKKLPILNQNQGIIDSEVLAKNQQDFKENLKHITQESLDSKKESTTSTTTTTPLEKNEESGSGMGMGPNG